MSLIRLVKLRVVDLCVQWFGGFQLISGDLKNIITSAGILG